MAHIPRKRCMLNWLGAFLFVAGSFLFLMLALFPSCREQLELVIRELTAP